MRIGEVSLVAQTNTVKSISRCLRPGRDKIRVESATTRINWRELADALVSKAPPPKPLFKKKMVDQLTEEQIAEFKGIMRYVF